MHQKDNIHSERAKKKEGHVALLFFALPIPSYNHSPQGIMASTANNPKV
ncbi:MAG: hypothetical protein ACI828_000460 [Flavobacteriales bacterium]|jgi:hypothetical protein